jgi:hypothetical protein
LVSLQGQASESGVSFALLADAKSTSLTLSSLDAARNKEAMLDKLYGLTLLGDEAGGGVDKIRIIQILTAMIQMLAGTAVVVYTF